jgi:FkbH-like protein
MSDDPLRRALARLDTDPGYAARLAVANALDAGSSVDDDLTPLRLAILRDFTVEPLVPVLRADLAKSGFRTTVWVGDFDTIGRDALSRTSGLDGFGADIILILRWLEQTAPALATAFVTFTPDQVQATMDEVVDRIGGELAAIRSRTTAPILIGTFPLPDVTTLGILDAQLETGHRRAVEDLNRAILKVAHGLPDVLVVDIARLVGRIGSRAAIDNRAWQTSRSPLSAPLLLALGAECAKFVRALRGSPRKCLVLDCDNTLWGGVVGEDGLGGIHIDPSYPGSAYLAFQGEVLNLRERGVLLALVSKNNEADVLEVLQEHPHMLIREHHLAAWRINWQDKATNLREIAKELNIGLDSFVFADDSEFETGLVREQLPEVCVLHLGAEPARFVSVLSEAAPFDSLAFSADDRARANQYVADRRRRASSQATTSIEGYLASLEMEVVIGPPGRSEIARVAQLTQKTNQFNLTTIRYTEGEIASRAASSQSDIHCLRLKDRFSDLGLVGVAIVDYDADDATIDTLLMSCRVLGRGAEDAFISHVAQAASTRGARRLIGMYRPTAKNEQVAAFFPDRGFKAAGAQAGTSRWELDLERRDLSPPPWIIVGGSERRDDDHRG